MCHAHLYTTDKVRIWKQIFLEQQLKLKVRYLIKNRKSLSQIPSPTCVTSLMNDPITALLEEKTLIKVALQLYFSWWKNIYKNVGDAGKSVKNGRARGFDFVESLRTLSIGKN